MSKAAWIIGGAAAALLAAAPAPARVSAHLAAPVGWSPGGRHAGGPGRAPFHNPPRGYGHDRRCGFGGGSCLAGGFGGAYWGYGYGGDLVEDPYYAARDFGFFSGPAEVLAAGGGAYYDYDRAYPYDWYHDPDPRERMAPMMPSAAPAMRCDVVRVPDRGERSAVRVCRGSR